MSRYVHFSVVPKGQDGSLLNEPDPIGSVVKDRDVEQARLLLRVIVLLHNDSDIAAVPVPSWSRAGSSRRDRFQGRHK